MIKSKCNYENSNIRIRTLYNHCSESMAKNHFHDTCEFYYLISGQRRFFIDNNIFDIKPGTIVIIKPNLLHKTLGIGDYHSRLLINFSIDYVSSETKELINNFLINDYSVIQCSEAMMIEIESLLEDVLHEANTRNVGYASSIQLHLTKVLLIASRYQNETNSQIIHTEQTPDKIKQIIQYLKQNYHQTISLETLAEEFFFSRYYLSRLFKKTTGFSLVEYLNSIRIVNAQRLLRETDLKIIDIANKTGFNNVSNFGKIFRKITEISPTAYRRQYQQAK